MKLIELKNGDWVDPGTITAIRILDESDGILGGFHAPRIAVHHGQFAIVIIEYPDSTTAYAEGRRLAMIVNETRGDGS